ncbi:MAG: penicillin-binding protein 1C [Cytophagaceae bacterium]|nr:penicillin-binding protein 1C [Cytophagaceae bacterium]MDW8456747.1 penicillin-binding protein 1C [Cytophagaceae bacterium]
MIFHNFRKRKLTLVFRLVVVGCLCLVLTFALLNFLFPFRIDVKYSTVVTSNDGNILYATLSADDKWRMKTELHEVQSDLKTAFIEKEDKYFYYHPGVNLFAVVRASIHNLISGKKKSGASTITMQVVRMLERRERNYLSKLIEMFRALQLELQYSKDEILQLYLNLVPYGGNIEGVKAASVLYFGCMPDKLSLAQVVTLCIIPNRPTTLRLGYSNQEIYKERNKWLKKFEAEGIFEHELVETAIKEPLHARRKKAPREIPHLALRLMRKYPGLNSITSTIHLPTQKKVEEICYNYIQRLKSIHIYNAAILIVNNKNGHVEGYVGSPDFDDAENAGQVDGVVAVRSPGSTLKPFIYGLSIDMGIITPKTVLADVPTDFDGYAPENFDKKFNGEVTAEKALAYSLNIPAVKLLEKVSVPVFLSYLKKAGFRHIASKSSSLGLSLILGGCGVTLEELTRAFSALARDGKLPTLRYTHFEKNAVVDSIISPQSSYMITSILSQITRPDLPNNYLNTYHLPQIAWKTGTSYGRRDAWSIGYNKKYTIGVWVGNFSGQGVHQLTGADIATPLLFEVFNAIDYNASNNWFFKPSNLEFRYVCQATGLIPGDHCTHQILDYYIPGISSIQKCEHLKTYFLSHDEKMSYCMHCLPSSGYKKKIFPNLDPEIADYYHKKGIFLETVPEHNPNCTRILESGSPRIVSPLNGKEYIISRQNTPMMLLKCIAQNNVRKVYWHINNQLYKEALASEKVYFRPNEGAIKISCTDDKGRNTDINIQVKYE